MGATPTDASAFTLREFRSSVDVALDTARSSGFAAGIALAAKMCDERAEAATVRAMEKHREGNGSGRLHWESCAEEAEECAAAIRSLPLSPEPEENKHQ